MLSHYSVLPGESMFLLKELRCVVRVFGIFQLTNPLDSMRSTWTSKNMPLVINPAQLSARVSIVENTQIVSFESFFLTGELPIQRVAVLKHILRSMHRMMQSPGTAEGLRGLIDMSLLSSIKKIVQYRGLFGATIFPLSQ